ncbi:MAG: hypothetical protein KDG89_13570 [Geminicoccaceae bacterium]|nr:hypothetical protein [Geminicoccaceae bacterium]
MAGWHPVTKAAVALGVVGVPVLLLTQGGGDAPPVAAARVPQEGRAPPADRMDVSLSVELGMLPPIEAFKAVVERPLFAPTRRPYEAPAPVTVAAVPDEPAADGRQEPGIVFVGTVRRGNGVLALANEEATGAIVSLAVGDEVNGWQVLSIEDRTMELGQAGERRKLAIFVPRDAPPPADTVPPDEAPPPQDGGEGGGDPWPGDGTDSGGGTDGNP